MYRFKTPECVYCVAGYEFKTESIRVEENLDTHIRYYHGGRWNDETSPQHATVDDVANFAVVTYSKYSMLKRLKNKNSLIPRGALEMLFEDGNES